MRIKKCTLCEKELTIDKFQKDKSHLDGYTSHCKECRNIANIIRSRKNYNKEKARQKYLKYKHKYKKYIKNDINNHPERHKARREAQQAINSGKIKRIPCENCGNKKSEAHHDDYSKPLKVRFLCKDCHAYVHRKKIILIKPHARKQKKKP